MDEMERSKMIIGVLSDSHDNIWKLNEALPHLQQADVVLHCGDLCAPFMIPRLGQGLPQIPIHIVWGNNDGDQYLIAQKASAFPAITLHGALAEVELGGLVVAVNHYPEIARGLALSAAYDLVCYGHDHTVNEEKLGDCVLLNPGELMGMNGRSTIALVDSETREVRVVDL
jgi:putative phosphoesterase